MFEFPILTNRAAKQRFEQADWNLHKQRILAGEMLDVFPYEPQRRFANQRRGGAPEPAAASP